jgi:hypothetical protein
MRTATIYRNMLAVLFMLGFTTACNDKDSPATDITGTVKLSFSNVVNTAPMVLNTQTYANPAGENYTISKFKYYITNIEVGNASAKAMEKDSYHLVDQSIASSQSFNVSMGVNNYTTLSFLLGVDSTRNVSGAQTGALDPLNDMFWTWNSGYIMAKMEGNSPVSTQPNNKVEYHIGGFSGANNVLKKITLTMPAGKTLDVRESKTSEIKITADFARWWQNPNNITIAALPVCTTPGTQAKQIADNYANMFTLTDVVNN